jgi:hypothetical protein
MELETSGQHRRADGWFFEVKGAFWRAGTIPGVTKIILTRRARLSFPEERPAAPAGHLGSRRDHAGTRP